MKLKVFDFDDTLVRTGSLIKITHKDGTTVDLNPSEYALYTVREGDEFDFSDFDTVVDPVRTKMMKVFRAKAIANKGKGVFVLTARSDKSKRAVRSYLRTIVGDDVMKRLKVVTLNSGDPYDKAMWIRNKVTEEGYDDVYFVDDSWKNCRAVGDVISNITSVKQLEIQKV